MDLDTFDHRILRVLRVDGRISNAALADSVGLSQSACLRRLRALEAGGIIRGYAALIDEPSEAAPTVVVIQITLERQTEDHLNRFEAAVKKCPEVRECYLMGGAADYLLRVETDGTAGYERIHKEVLSRLPGVARIHSSFAIRTIVRGRATA